MVYGLGEVGVPTCEHIEGGQHFREEVAPTKQSSLLTRALASNFFCTELRDFGVLGVPHMFTNQTLKSILPVRQPQK